MEDFIHINLFYISLFIFLIITVVTVCSVIKSRNGNMTFKDMFCLSSNNSKEVMIDTTDKMKDMHTEVINILPETYEKELHSLNTDIKSTNERLERLAEELNNKMDLLLERVIRLEKK